MWLRWGSWLKRVPVRWRVKLVWYEIMRWWRSVYRKSSRRETCTRMKGMRGRMMMRMRWYARRYALVRPHLG
jgi:hypothetical protein